MTPRRTGRGALAAGAAVALLAVAATGLGMARQASAAAVAPAPVPTSATMPQTPAVPGERIGQLMGGPATTGLFDAHGVRAIVSVLCSGDGTIELRIGEEPPIVLTCEAGGPALAMLRSTEDLRSFTLSVHPQPHLRWSLAVGAMALSAD